MDFSPKTAMNSLAVLVPALGRRGPWRRRDSTTELSWQSVMTARWCISLSERCGKVALGRNWDDERPWDGPKFETYPNIHEKMYLYTCIMYSYCTSIYILAYKHEFIQRKCDINGNLEEQWLVCALSNKFLVLVSRVQITAETRPIHRFACIIALVLRENLQELHVCWW